MGSAARQSCLTHDLPPVSAVALFLLHQQLGAACWVAVSLLVIMFPLNMVLMRKSASLLKAAMSHTDERTKLEGELVGGIEVVKCSAWEAPFLERVTQARRREIAQLWRVSSLNAVILFVLYGEVKQQQTHVICAVPALFMFLSDCKTTLWFHPLVLVCLRSRAYPRASGDLRRLPAARQLPLLHPSLCLPGAVQPAPLPALPAAPAATAGHAGASVSGPAAGFPAG